MVLRCARASRARELRYEDDDTQPQYTELRNTGLGR